jgi:hypothetical protein
MRKNSCQVSLAEGTMNCGMPSMPGPHCHAARKTTNSSALPIIIWRTPGCITDRRAALI